MCCRFLGDTSSPEYQKILELMERHYPGQYKTGEIGPGDTSPAFAFSGSSIGPVPAVFGLLGPDGKQLIINARSETVREKPLFRESFQSRRLVLPATAFYEWRKKEIQNHAAPKGIRRDGSDFFEGDRPQPPSRKKDKYQIRMAGVPLFYLCGLYQMQEGRCRFAILTRKAEGAMQAIHDRMPLMARPSQVKGYLKDPLAAWELIESPGPELVPTKAPVPLGGQFSFSFGV